MGKGCEPKNLLAIIRAKGQTTGDIFSEAERVKNFNAEQRFHYESFMAKEFGVDLKKNKPSAFDIMHKRAKVSSDPHLLKDRMYANPSLQFSKKFYGAIDKKAMTWANSKNPDLKSFREQVGKPAKKVLDAIDKLIEDSQTRRDFLAGIKRFGLDENTIYDGRNYLQWLADGGHLQKGDVITEALKKPASVIAKAQANLNMLWTLGNSMDMIRIYSHYATRRGGFVNVVKGSAAALKEGNIFARNPKLIKEKIYESDYMETRGRNRDPFSWSVTAQKNLTYHLDKASGGDGYTGIRDLVFDSKPWDQPYAFRSPASNLYFGLFRYPINESRWHFKTTKAALSGDMRAQANLALYAIAKATFVGVRATFIPAIVYAGMPQEWKEAIADWEKTTGFNIVQKGSEKIAKAAGMDASLDFTEYTQPFGGKAGVRLGTITDTVSKVGKTGTKTVVNLAQGKLDAAAVNAIATASALNNLTGFANSLKFVGKAAEAVNSTTVTKLLETTAKALEEEFTADKVKIEYAKDLLGDKNVKRTDNSNVVKMPELPKLPKLPSAK